MQSYLSHLNYNIEEQNIHSVQIQLIVIKNPDGTPRWIIPSHAKSAYFLKFYNVSNFKSKIISLFFRIVFKLRIQKIILKSKKYNISLADNKNAIYNLEKTDWALFTGTIGPNNKMILYSNSQKSFYKIATTDNSKNIIANELNTLHNLSSLKPTFFYFPEILDFRENYLVIKDVSSLNQRFKNLSPILVNAISEYGCLDNEYLLFEEFTSKTCLNKTLNELSNLTDTRLPIGLINKLQLLEKRFHNQKIEICFSHGDFTPWNMFQDDDKAAIYDWELANKNYPLGFDGFHFIIQDSILVRRLSWKSIKNEIDIQIQDKTIYHWSRHQENNQEKYLGLYLLTNIIKYLDIYTKQANWHTQIHWLINTWSEALTSILIDEKPARSWLIIDLFDWLNPLNYAALKIPNHAPELLSRYSDIDICIEQHDEKKIIDFIENHPCVKQVNKRRKSFMNCITIVLTDSSILSLDLIWQFKRKQLVFLDAKQLLDTNSLNNFGVRTPSNEEISRYVGLFYGLNNSKIPEKYLELKQFLKNELQKDKLVINHYSNMTNSSKDLNVYIRKEKSNHGLSLLKNSINYLIDTVRNMNSKNGIIITFSGVDGAGKSTIIEKVKYELEKKYRKRVVVIRHRPSILPILSAWTKGKAKAEQDAATRLPRQGENKSSISSLLRFLYYYSDYILGQFYINVKYKYRGFIVLYDRYYYDFIIDGRRSNILTNEKFVKFGYNFVFTPSLNFFLYADPEVILSRKQELSSETIIELTNKYKQLFNYYENKKKQNNYHTINNIDIQQTIDTIISQINFKLN